MQKVRFSFDGRAKVLATGLVVLFALLALVPIASALMAGRGFMWSVLPDEPVILDVCWENPTSANATAREWIRLALKRSWERYARVIFVGWDQCQDEGSPATPPYSYGPRRPGTADENIKVELRSTGAAGQNPAHGSWGDYQQTGVWLAIDCDRPCIEHLAIHEFGHVLGYYHGEERSDWVDPGGCPKQSWSPSPPWWPVPTEMPYGDPDPDSVMAYCSGQSTELSPIDIAGAQRYYQRHLPGTVLSAVASLCLAAHADYAGNGERAFGWACDEVKDDQEWIYDWVNHSLHIEQTGPPINPRCLDVDTQDYTEVQTWDCHYGPNQQWQFRRVMLRGYGGLCLTRPATGRGPVTMQECDGLDTQLWRIEPGSQWASVRFKSEVGYTCLAARGGSGASVVAETCADAYAVFLPLVQRVAGNGLSAPAAAADPAPRQILAGGQDFYLLEGGKIRMPTVAGGPAYCFDVHDVWDSEFTSGQGGPQVGQRVQLFTCYDSQLNQRWNLTGDIVSGNKCLTLSGDNTANGAPASVSRCNGLLNQDWDYYW